jgi:hypothetical protein
MAEEAYARAEAIRADVRSGSEAPRTSPPAPTSASSARPEPRPGDPAAGRPSARPAGEEIAPAPPVDRRQPSPVFALAERRAVLAAVERWRAAWSAQDVDGYLDSYVPGYRPDAATTHEDWRRIRRERLTRPEWIEVTLEGLELRAASGDGARVAFEQAYTASNYADRERKTLRLERRDGRWLIAEDAPSEALGRARAVRPALGGCGTLPPAPPEQRATPTGTVRDARIRVCPELRGGAHDVICPAARCDADRTDDKDGPGGSALETGAVRLNSPFEIFRQCLKCSVR